MLPKLLYWTDGDVPGDAMAYNPGAPRPAGVPGEAAPVGKLYTKQRGSWGLAVPGEVELSWVAVAEGHWVSVIPGGDLHPEQLERGVKYDFHPVTAGGGVWKIPVARAMDGGSRLPSVRGLDAKGRACWKVLPQYRKVHEYARKVFDNLTADGRFTDEEADEACAVAFGVGYRLGRVELLALEMLNPETIAATVKALVDWPTFEALKKKNPPPPKGYGVTNPGGMTDG